MTLRILGAVAIAVLAVTLAAPASSQAAPAAESRPLVMAQASSGTEAPSRRARKRSETRPRKEPTAAQMMTRERQRKCSVEWHGAKAAGTVETGTKWPKFWSACNARLKGNSA
jgi:hypothetical protein